MDVLADTTVLVTVPKTPVYENRPARGPIRDIGRARKITVSDAIPHARVEDSSYDELRLRVPLCHGGHHARPGFGVDDIQ